MQPSRESTEPDFDADRKPPTALVVVAVLALLALGGALHLMGVLPPGS